ncbi:MAG: hypothetical protein ACHQUC_09730 [Chlamydiales bacterium]
MTSVFLTLKDTVHAAVVKPFVLVWGPTRSNIRTTHPLGACLAIAKLAVTVPLKFLGRTVTLGVCFAVTACALKALAETSLGAAIGVTSFVATIASFPPLLLAIAALTATVATGLLTSYLIEKYS